MRLVNNTEPMSNKICPSSEQRSKLAQLYFFIAKKLHFAFYLLRIVTALVVVLLFSVTGISVSQSGMVHRLVSTQNLSRIFDGNCRLWSSSTIQITQIIVEQPTGI